jgi:peptidoglycan hydrolase-like protein with peptidoglycan-binding domain
MQETVMLPTIRLGSLGESVKTLQQALNLWHETDQPRLTEDGFFGLRTNSKVREFQSAYQLSPDGVVGPLTWEALSPLVEEVTREAPAAHEDTRIVLTEPPAIPAPLAASGMLRVSRAWTAMPSVRRQGMYRRASGE